MRESRYRRQNAKRAVVRELKKFSFNVIRRVVHIVNCYWRLVNSSPLNWIFVGGDVTVDTQKKRGKGPLRISVWRPLWCDLYGRNLVFSLSFDVDCVDRPMPTLVIVTVTYHCVFSMPVSSADLQQLFLRSIPLRHTNPTAVFWPWI